ncbi:DNA invertase Pin-like site-specific DNA recombinase [Hamadaea flava]|uniref:Recombinase family protein n=1 Tax=Hamadaea flava TaxID=1742688 RepID=A0ABV8M0M1_9ACTN|nr:recombinase family protein [Hamadaea flava]MCP2328453.1 DNA invertase Pin-like site-specific DNA recombinase [Hamadaea flava]
MGKPRNALGFARLSDLRLIDLDEDGRAKGNIDQEQRIRDYAKAIGWRITRVIVENDLVRRADGSVKGVSAFKRRKVKLPDGRHEWRTYRPGLRLSLDLLARGEHDGFIPLDLDRAFRDPRDLEDLIDVAAEYNVPVESVTGSLRLNNDADITMARVMVAMANKASRDTSRRVSAARERQARAGEYGGGKRPYGFEEDGVTVRPDEAAVLLDCSIRVVQAADADDNDERTASLRSIALDLRLRKIPTVTGAPWSSATLRQILLRPRNAGIMIFKGKEIGQAPWDPIVPLETFRAVQRILQDPNRRTNPGSPPKYLGSSLYKCGICTDAKFTNPVGVEVSRGGSRPRYRCKDSTHLVRDRTNVDKLVVSTILKRLQRKDAVDLLQPTRPDVDIPALRSEATAIRTNLKAMAADQVLGRVTREQLYAATEVGTKRLDEIDSELNAATVDSPLKPLIGVEDIEAAWERLPLSHQRLVLDTLVTVRILPVTKRGPGFDPAAVEIKFKKHRSGEQTPRMR